MKQQEIIFEKSSIFFRRKYFFRASTIYTPKKIESIHIKFIALHTNFFKSIIILNNEIIFIDECYRIMLMLFADRNNISIVEFYDIWDDLAWMVDFDFDSLPNTMRRLNKMRYTEGELTVIISKYKNRLKMTTYWDEMDLWRLLNTFFFLTKEKYFGIMEISLDAFYRNLRVKGQGT